MSHDYPISCIECGSGINTEDQHEDEVCLHCIAESGAIDEQKMIDEVFGARRDIGLNADWNSSCWEVGFDLFVFDGDDRFVLIFKTVSGHSEDLETGPKTVETLRLFKTHISRRN